MNTIFIIILSIGMALAIFGIGWQILILCKLKDERGYWLGRICFILGLVLIFGSMYFDAHIREKKQEPLLIYSPYTEPQNFIKLLSIFVVSYLFLYWSIDKLAPSFQSNTKSKDGKFIVTKKEIIKSTPIIFVLACVVFIWGLFMRSF